MNKFFRILMCALTLSPVLGWASGSFTPGPQNDAFSDKQYSEFHWLICNADKNSIESKMGFDKPNSKAQQLVYLDTAREDFYAQGGVLRIRANSDKTEVTAKIIRDTPSQIKSKWLNDNDVSCEYDVTPLHKSFACSLEVDLGGMTVDGKSAGDLLSLFSDDQREFFADHGIDLPSDGASLSLAGPVDFQSRKYTIEDLNSIDGTLSKDFSGKWSLEDLQQNGQPLFEGMELSVRMKSKTTYDEATQELSRRHLQICTDQSSKTKAVLDHFFGAH